MLNSEQPPRPVHNLFCHFVVLLFCHFFVLSFCHFVILSFCHFVILSFCHFVILSFSHFVILSFCRFVVSGRSGSRCTSGTRWRWCLISSTTRRSAATAR